MTNAEQFPKNHTVEQGGDAKVAEGPTTRIPSTELGDQLLRYLAIWSPIRLSGLPTAKLIKLRDFSRLLPIASTLSDNQLLWLHYFVVPNIEFSTKKNHVTIDQIVEHFRAKGIEVSVYKLAAFFKDVFTASNKVVIGQLVLECDGAKQSVNCGFDAANNRQFLKFLAELILEGES